MERTKSTLLCCMFVFSLVIITGISGDSSSEGITVTEELQVIDGNATSKSDSTELPAAEEPKTLHDVYQLGPKIVNWDEQRAKWLEENPGRRLTRKGKPRMILVTSSQTGACESPSGDYYLLKSAKNKIDYTRLHDIQIYYNMVTMDPLMNGFFIKHPLVRKLMVSHPEAEWIWWMDSDAMFTDMSFEIPLEKYKDHNMVIHGWDGAIYEQKNWVGLNAGIFLMRNCRWSLDLLDTWAAMGEDSGDNLQQMGALATQALDSRPDFPIDDQSALVYLLSISKTEELKPKVFLENAYALHGFWVWAMGKHDSMLKEPPASRVEGEEYFPFITHFVGCKSCTGHYASYDLHLCLAEMERAFNLADNQVLHMYGFEHKALDSVDVKQTRRDWLRPLNFLRKSPLDFLRQNPWTGTASRVQEVPTSKGGSARR